MVTRARGYHSGFNMGFNIAEAVNFALPTWLEIGKNVSACKCVKDSVSFNMGNFIQNIERSEFLKKIEKNNSRATFKPKGVEFDANSKLYGLSENLHSFKNTPNNLKMLPRRSNSFSLLTNKIKPSKPIDE